MIFIVVIPEAEEGGYLPMHIGDVPTGTFRSMTHAHKCLI
jgi:hypothetical protein